MTAARSERARLRMIAAAVGACAFAFRVANVNDLSNDHYMHLAWAQQLLFGELPGRDFVDPGMPLAYLLSALVQLFSPGPFGEAVVCCAMLAIAAAVTVVVTADLTASVAAGVGAALVQVALYPRLYSYPKILVPTVALLLIQQYARRRDRRSLVLMAAWTAVAVLLRHDLGVYAAAGVAAALLWMHRRDLAVGLRAAGVYAAGVILLMIPYVVFVTWAEGLPEHFHEAIEFARGEAHQRFVSAPAFPFAGDPAGLAAWNSTDSATLLFYIAHVVAIGALVALFGAWRARESTVDAARGGPGLAAALAMLVFYLVVVLRHPIVSRIQDVAALLTIVGAWEVVMAFRQGVTGRIAAVALAAVSLFSVWNLGGLTQRIAGTRLSDGVEVMMRAMGAVDAEAQWPWERFWPAGEMPEAIRYLNACTTPDDAVMLTWAAPEYYFFARRRFAAGHALFLPPDSFTTPHDQARMIERLEHRRVPIVLINETRRSEFATAYGDVDRYLKDQYVPAGHFRIREGSDVTIAIRRGLRADGSYGAERWPCGFDNRAASRTASIMLDGSAMSFPAISNAVP